MQDIIDKLNNLPGLKVLSILNKERFKLDTVRESGS